MARRSDRHHHCRGIYRSRHAGLSDQAGPLRQHRNIHTLRQRRRVDGVLAWTATGVLGLPRPDGGLLPDQAPRGDFAGPCDAGRADPEARAFEQLVSHDDDSDHNHRHVCVCLRIFTGEQSPAKPAYQYGDHRFTDRCRQSSRPGNQARRGHCCIQAQAFAGVADTSRYRSLQERQ